MTSDAWPENGNINPDTIIWYSLSFLHEDPLIWFDNIEMMLSDIVGAGKIDEFVWVLYQDPLINAWRKLMITQLIIIKYSSLFSPQVLRGFFLLLWYYTRIARDPKQYLEQKIVPISASPSIVIQVREYTWDILRESNSLLSAEESKSLLCWAPFSLWQEEYEKIRNTIYIEAK